MPGLGCARLGVRLSPSVLVSRRNIDRLPAWPPTPRLGGAAPEQRAEPAERATPGRAATLCAGYGFSLFLTFFFFFFFFIFFYYYLFTISYRARWVRQIFRENRGCFSFARASTRRFFILSWPGRDNHFFSRTASIESR